VGSNENLVDQTTTSSNNGMDQAKRLGKTL